MKRGLLLAAAFVLVVNAVTLALVWRNRSGAPDTIVTLTERELSLWDSGPDDTSIRLRLHVESLSPDRRQLEAAGFDCRVAPGDPSAERHYRLQGRRRAYAVVEYEGEGWRERARKEEERAAEAARRIGESGFDAARARQAQTDYERFLRTATRLTIVDIGSDATALRSRYGDRARYLILPTAVDIHIDRANEKEKPLLSGYARFVEPGSLHVPVAWRATLNPLSSADRHPDSPPGPHAPRYQVSVAVGRALQPWVIGVQRLPR